MAKKKLTLTNEQALKVVEHFGHDGHTIWDPEAIIEKCKIPREIVDTWTTVEKSDGTPKGTIFGEEGIIQELKGVYGLSMLMRVAEMVKADTSKCIAMGRGTLASQYTQAILKKVKDGTDK